MCGSRVTSWFRKPPLSVPPQMPRTQALPSPTHLVWGCLFGLMWGAGTSPTPGRPAVFSTHFASVIIFCMQGSLMCNKCKWAMYILCFIHSHSSLWLPGLRCLASTPPQDPQRLLVWVIIRVFLFLPAPSHFEKPLSSRGYFRGGPCAIL